MIINWTNINLYISGGRTLIYWSQAGLMGGGASEPAVHDTLIRMRRRNRR